MATMRLPGLVTGIDTNTLVAQLMAIQRQTLNMYVGEQSLWEEKKSALSTLETKLSTLRTTLRELSDADELRAFSVSSSDTDYLTAEASYNAFEGNHNVVINQLANAERWVHTAGEEYAEDYVGAGTFVYSYNYKETSITTTATTTLEDLVGLINNDANNPGVTATLLYYNDAYHLVLNGDEAGTDYQVKINEGRTEVWKSDDPFTKGSDNATLNTKITELDQFSGSVSGGSPYIRITGADHFGVAATQTDLPVTENTTIAHLISEINDAFDGAAKAVFEDGKIILTDSEDGASSLSINLEYFDDGTGSSLDNLAMSFTTQGADSVADLTNYAPSGASTFFTLSQAAQDSKIKVDGFPSTAAASEVQTVSLSEEPNDGTYTLTYRGETTTVLDESADAATIEAALEALSTVNTGDITASGPLSDGMTFTFANTLGDVDLIMIDDSLLLRGGSPVTASIAETTPGSDGYIGRSSNTVDDVIYGVALHLHDVTDANGQEITLTRDIASVKEKLNSMISAYNLAVNFIKEKTGYNDVTKVGGVLQGDYIVTDIRSQIRNSLISQTSGFVIDIDTFLTPAQIGLELDDDGLLNLDTNVFDEAIAEDYLGTLAIIGADKTGSSTSDVVEFYGASSTYTTAGNYDVKVVVSGGEITTAKIKLSTESTYRDATVDGNIITGDLTFNDDGYALYPENGLQLSVDLSQDGTYGTDENPIVVRVKQGFTGEMKDAIDRVLRITTGSLQIAQKYADNTIDALKDRIDDEKDRLETRETRLIEKFAKLEGTLARLQLQMAGLFGSGLM
jgi:flagellar hook-associated protein 2